MGTLKKEVFIGLIIGLLANIAGCYLYIYIFSTHNLEETIQYALAQDVLGNIIALGAILNLFVFFIFIKKKQDNRAKGVLLATILIALTTLILKFF